MVHEKSENFNACMRVIVSLHNQLHIYIKSANQVKKSLLST